MYSMWIDSKKDVYNYLKNKETDGVKKCYPLAFNIDGRIGVKKFKIEELDMLTSQYEDEQNFLSDLLAYGDTYMKESPKNHIMITYHKGDIISSSPVIYNDRMIYLKANEIRRKKKKKEGKVLLEMDPLLDDFITFMKRLARRKTSRRYMLSPDSLDDVSYTDKKALKKLMKDDVRKFLGEVDGEAQYKVVEKGIKNLLMTYVKEIDLLEYNQENGISTLKVQEELEEVEEEIELYFRRDYRNLRTMVAFENKYLEVLEKSIKMDDSISNRIVVSPLIQEVRLQKKVRNGIEDRRTLEDYYISIDNPIAPKEPDFIDSEEVRLLLKEGGIAAVMEHLDADQLYRQYLSDTERLGIVKQKEKW